MPPASPSPPVAANSSSPTSAAPLSLRRTLAGSVLRAAAEVVGADALAGVALRDAGLTAPKHAAHGDLTTPIALSLAKRAGRSPRDIAMAIAERLRCASALCESVDVAGPGHVNVRVCGAALRERLWLAAVYGAATLRSDVGLRQRVLLEYVSANPTGPLHVAHGRGAVFGDVVARLLVAAGYEVEREYYVNDMGNQTDVLARSVWAHLEELRGKPFVAPDEYYPGDYVRELAVHLYAEHPHIGLDAHGQLQAFWLPEVREFATAQMLARIQQDLAQFNVEFDRFVSERALTEKVDAAALVARLQASGHVYEEGGKQWFRSTDFGDDKDRVLVREDGRPTYFFGDLAYHEDKMQRGYHRLINVWGADHGGYVARIKASMAALGHDPNALDVPLVQMVSLTRGGQAVKMGKRLGTAVWLKDVIDEAGRDATRYLFLLRRLDAQMEFDVELASRKSLDNPVYYAQMGHARLRAIERRAVQEGVALPPPAQWRREELEALTLPEELSLMRALAQAPDVVAAAAQAHEPHAVATFVQELIAQFHSYYTRYKHSERVISLDQSKTRARLLLCRALANVLQGLLALLGVDAPEQMQWDESEASAGREPDPAGT